MANKNSNKSFSNAAIYVETKKLLELMHGPITRMSKDAKYTLGHQMLNDLSEISTSISRTYNCSDTEKKYEASFEILKAIDNLSTHFDLSVGVCKNLKNIEGEVRMRIGKISLQARYWNASFKTKSTDNK